MPARRLAAAPREYLVKGEWPDGALARNAPAEARQVAGVAQRLRDAVEGRSLRSVATEAGLSIGTVSNLLGGRTWGDLVTLARLENALGVHLWCGVHAPHDDDARERKVRSGRTAPPSGRSDSKRRSEGDK